MSEQRWAAMDETERAAERRFHQTVWRHHRWGWQAEIDRDALMSPITGWGATWRPTERMAHAWADRRIVRLLAMRDREEARRQAKAATKEASK